LTAWSPLGCDQIERKDLSMAKRNINAPPPAYAWPEMPTDRSGLDPDRLEAWWKLLKKNKTKSIFLVRNDRVVFERYVTGFDRH
jgi:hypothetical protein